MILCNIPINNTRHSSSSRGLTAILFLRQKCSPRQAMSLLRLIEYWLEKELLQRTNFGTNISGRFHIMGLMHNLIVYYYKDFIFQFLHDLTRCFKIYWTHVSSGCVHSRCAVASGWMVFLFFSCTTTLRRRLYLRRAIVRPCTRWTSLWSSKDFVSCL